jgi:hypothetical protein
VYASVQESADIKGKYQHELQKQFQILQVQVLLHGHAIYIQSYNSQTIHSLHTVSPKWSIAGENGKYKQVPLQEKVPVKLL